MNWWCPFQITITEGWLGVLGTLAGVVIGFLLESIRNRKSKKERHREFMISVQAEVEAAALHLVSLAKSCMIAHLGFVFLERKTRELVEKKFDDYNLHLAQIDVNRREYNSALNKYEDRLYEFYKYLNQFCSYLNEDDSERIIQIAFKMTEVELRKYHYLTSVSEEEIRKFNFNLHYESIPIFIDKTYGEEVRLLRIAINAEVMKFK